MEKSTKTILIILGIAAVLLFIFKGQILLRTVYTSDEHSGIGGSGEVPANIELNFLTINMYDAEGKIIEQPATEHKQSIVNGVNGVSYVTVTATLYNNGQQALTCVLDSFSTDLVNSNATGLTGTKLLLIGNTTTWTTSLISVSPFETLGSATFGVRATCTPSIGSPIQKASSVTLTIQPEAVGNFTISVSSGGISTQWCGDGTCQSVETLASCLNDCNTGTPFIRFRTNDSMYVPGSSIAFTDVSGQVLTKYSGKYRSSTYTGTCTATNINTKSSGFCGGSAVYSIGTPIIVPPASSGWLSGGSTPSIYTAAANSACICDDNGANFQLIYYSIDSGASVSNSQYSTYNSVLES